MGPSLAGRGNDPDRGLDVPAPQYPYFAMRPQSQAETAQALLRYLQPIERQDLNVLLCRHEIIVWWIVYVEGGTRPRGRHGEPCPRFVLP